MQKSETMTTRNKRSKMAKSDSAAGGRSGVIIEKADDDNVDNWFDTARSPQQQRGTASSSLEQVKPPRTSTARTKKISRKRTVKTPRKKVSMLLPGAVAASEIVVDSNDVAGKDGEGKMVLTATKAKKYADKLRSRKGGGVMDFTSPSDLSRVSTAPLSPDDGEWRKEGSEEMKTPADKEELKSDDVDDSSETENIMLTQEESVDNDNDIVDDAGTSLVENNVDDVAKHQSATATVKENTENIEHPPSSPEDDDFPAGGDQDEEQPEDNDDDLGPPVLPDDYSKEEEEDDDDNDKDKVEKRQFDSKMMDENNYNDDDKNESIDAGINDDDDDDLGFELNMVHDPETPQTVREARAKKEKEKLQNEKNEGKKTKKKTESESDIDADENIDESQFTPKMKKGTKKQKKRKKRNVIFSPKGIPTGNRDYEMVPIGTLIEGSPDEAGPRRSRRAKVKPLEYWRNEKMEYGAHNEDGYMGEVFGNMPVVTGIQKALPTPYKKRKPQVNDRSAVAKKKRRKNFIDDEDEEEEFDSKKLRKRYSYLDGEEAYLWDDAADNAADQKIVAYASQMEGSDLPISKRRRKSEGKVTGKAAQAFNILNDEKDNYVGYIMGNLILPPKGVKDSESVGPCAQTFTVCHCQPKSVEVAYGDPDESDGILDVETAQRFLLGPGDMFRVPPGNSYRLQNHSQTTDSLLTWTIIRPRSVPS